MASKFSTNEESGSAEIVEMYCELCKKKGKYRTAEAFCVTCVKYFCQDCLGYHSEFLPNHVHQDGTTMPQDVCLIPCPQHDKEIIKFYCLACDMFFCSECKKIDHKECNDVRHLPELAKNLEKRAEYLNLKENLEDIEKKSKEIIIYLNKHKKSSKTMFEEALMEIDLLRDRLIEWVDDSIGTLKSDLKATEDTEMETFEDNYSKLSTVISEISAMKTTIENKILECKRCELFMSIKDFQSKQKSLEKDVLQVKEHKLQEIHFEVNSEIQSLLENPIKLGNIASKSMVHLSSVEGMPDVQFQKSYVASELQKPLKEGDIWSIEQISSVEGMPDIQTQKSYVANELQKPLIKGDVWYIIDIKWFKQWKSYVGYETWDHYNVGEDCAYPGPIDNTPILKEGSTRLKEHLINDLDYVMVPEECWKKLTELYGLANEKVQLARQVIEEGVYSKSLMVEVYRWHLKMCKHSNKEKQIIKKFSRTCTIGQLKEEMRKEFSIPNDKEVRLWQRYMTNMYEQLNKMQDTLQDAGLYQGQLIIIEQKNPDGTWPMMKK